MILLKQKFRQVQLEPNPPYKLFAVHNSYIRVHLMHVSKLTFALLTLEIHHFSLYGHCSFTSLLTNDKP